MTAADALSENQGGGRPLVALSTLLMLGRRARHARDLAEFTFLAVNETHTLIPYRQAALWSRSRRGGEVLALSGVAAVDRHAPYVAWLERLMAWLATGEGANDIQEIAAAAAPDHLAIEWAEWLPAYALRLPLRAPDGTECGALLLARGQPWSESDRKLLGQLADVYGHAWAFVDRQPRRRLRLKRWDWALLAVALALLGAGFVPVRQSVLAPAEVVARDPVVVRAALDGVVDHFRVRPNETVAAGQVLVEFDRTRLESERNIARQALRVAEAEYRQAAQKAVSDPSSKAALAILRARRERQATELAYIEDRLARTWVRSPRDGVAVFDDPGDWIGRPVRTGERLLLIADPATTQVEIRLPVADAITLEPGNEVRLFLNTAPQAPLSGSLTYASYQAGEGADGVLAYRLKAKLAPEMLPLRLGLKGTAKIYGERTTLFYYILRRPLSALRQWSGL